MPQQLCCTRGPVCPNARQHTIERERAMPLFLTLGPPGSNHDFVLRRYLAAHKLLERARVEFVDDFHLGAQRVITGEADFMLQCAVHPATPEITGHYRQHLFVVDAFISQSRPMALLRTRQRGDAPDSVAHSVGVQPATQHYADLSAWPRLVPERTVADVGEGLLQGRYGAGIAFASLAAQHPERLELVQMIGSICDAWVVFGPTPVDGGAAEVWTGAPVSRLYAGAGRE